jgi:dethiobiotin synthetase
LSRGLFVTGTDTNVGKTAVAAALMCRYRSQAPLRYWKPIQTGIEQDDDTATVIELGHCSAREIVGDGLRLARPVSPHLAARWSGVSIDIAPLVAIHRGAREDTAWIVEGAGGALVPINDRETVADLMLALAFPAVVVARTALGTINHTLLTIEALRRRSIAVAGIVLVGPADPNAREAIETHGQTTVVGEMPQLTPLTAEALAAWAPALDPAGRLLEWLR